VAFKSITQQFSVGFVNTPQLTLAFHRRKRPVADSWRMDETYVKVKGEWQYLYRAVDKYGVIIDFVPSEKRDAMAKCKMLAK
jgi:putative transposase